MTAAIVQRRSRAHRPAAEPNVIPFIDVLLVLLIIFMVTAPKPTVDLQVDMPPRNTTYEPPLIPPTVVELRESGAGYRLLVDERDVALERLGRAVLAHVRAKEPVLTAEDALADARIYVRSDQGVAYGSVVGVIDELRTAGFARVSIYAQTAEET